MKIKKILFAAWSCSILPAISFSQNIAVNTTGTAAAAANMFEVTQASTTNNTIGIFATHTGAATNAYAIWAAATGATNKYAMVVPSGGGQVGIGTIAPSALLDVVYAGPTSSYASKILHSGNASSPGTGLAVSNGYPTSSASGAYEIFGIYSNSFVNNLVTVRDNGNVGIGTTTPQTALHLVSSIPLTTLNLHPYRTGFIVEGDRNTFGGRISIRQADSMASITIFRTNGTFAAPTTLLSGQTMGRVAFGGYDGTIVNSFFGMNAIAAQNWTNVAHGAHLTFHTVNLGGGWSGTEKMRITSEGNVGIGTTAPNYPLEIASGTGQYANALSILPSTHATSRRGSMKIDDWMFVQDINGVGTKDFEIWQGSAALCRFYISTAGDVAIGHFSPVGKLDIRSGPGGLGTTLYSSRDFTGEGNTNAAFIGGTDFAKTNTGIYVLQKDNIGFSTTTTYLLNVVENGNSKMLVTGAGCVGVGTVAPVTKLDVEGTHTGAAVGTGGWSDGASQLAVAAGCDGASRFYDWPSGWGGGISTYDICGSGVYATVYSSRSDKRFKKDIHSLTENSTDLTARFMKLRPVTYFINPQTLKVNDPNRKRFGFIANEVEDIFPNLVINAGQPENITRGLEYDGFIPILVNIAQEQQKVIEQLKNDKAASDARIEKLEKIVALLVQASSK